MEAIGEDGHTGEAVGPGGVEKAVGTGFIGGGRFGSDGAVEIFRNLGYRYIALNPGSSFRGLHDSIVNFNSNRDPQLLLCLHEEIAISLAHGYVKAGGGPIATAFHFGWADARIHGHLRRVCGQNTDGDPGRERSSR